MGKLKRVLKKFLPLPADSLVREIHQTQQMMQTLLTQQKELLQEHTALEKKQAKLVQDNAELVQNNAKLVQNQEKLARDNANLRQQIRKIETGIFRTTPQPRLAYFVLNILDHCNLRCKGCDHFAAIAEKRFVALEDIRRDLRRMAELTEGRVTRIGVMGGEPLLYPELKEILIEARKCFPQTLIQVVSNGLLMNQQEDAFWATCRDYKIAIVVTKYPLNLDFEKMEATAEKWGVDFSYYGRTGEAIKTSYKMTLDPNGRQNPMQSFWNCYHANSLPLLMEGKFYPCTIAPNVRHFNQKFGTDMEVEQGDYLDIYAIKDISEVYRFLCTPKPFCRFCKTEERSFEHPWGQSEQKKEEWI